MTNYNVQREEIENIYGKISPFEFKNRLINLAEGQKEKSARTLLDAGRGNPNWTAATPRDAFFTFGHFAVDETKRVWSDNDLGGMPKKTGIADRFFKYIDTHSDFPGADLLKQIVEYGINDKGFDPDEWVFELADGIIGDNYPLPDRMLTHAEKVVHDYLVNELCYNKPPVGRFNIFAVEGATAAMCYIFDTLLANELLAPGDKIALMTPIFTPYLEIPHLPRYDFQVVEIHAIEKNEYGEYTWQYPESELKKIGDPSIKALFLVNPSNPPSIAIRGESINLLVNIVKNQNPNLMIISDDVYGTFVDNFRSLIADLPYNTIGVYSYSKYFGVTGWRLGTIALHEDNVFDKLLKELPEDKKAELRIRYGDLSTTPDKVPFIDRIVADSRQVALNHTAGLSTPQQVQMAFFSVFSLLDKENRYKELTKSICRNRQRLLYNGLGIEVHKNPYDAAYYTQFDLLEWARHLYGDEFATYVESHHKPLDVLFRLAEESSIVLLGGGGFHGPEWSIRISLANLPDEAYSKIGEVLSNIMKEYHTTWQNSVNNLVLV